MGLDKQVKDVLHKHPFGFSNVQASGAFDLTNRFDAPMYEDLYDVLVHEMPYGTAKARTGDPVEWITDFLFDEGYMESSGTKSLSF